jgi:hypothetical protein
MKVKAPHEANGSSYHALGQDGISLFDSDPFRATHRMTRWSSGLTKGDKRVRRLEPIGHDYYKYVLQGLVIDPVFVSDQDVPIHEIGFLQIVNGKPRKGCSYESVINQDDSVMILPVTELTQEEYADAVRCASFFHPVVPYVTTQNKEPDLTLFEQVMQIPRRAKADAGSDEDGRRHSVFFIQGDDVYDIQYLEGLKSRLASGDCYYVLDVFADGVFTVEVLS